MAEVMSVLQAAAELGVSDRRVRALIDARVLEAKRLGGSWVVDAASVRNRKARGQVPGRPLEPAGAWLALAALQLLMADDLETPVVRSISDAVEAVAAGDDQISTQTSARLSELLGKPASAERWARWLSRRATVTRVWAHPAALKRLRIDARVHAGGAASVDAALRLGLALAAGDSEIFYAASGDIGRIRADLRLRDDPSGQIQLCAVDDDLARRYLPAGPVPAAVALADLLDSQDARDHDLAVRFLREVAMS